MHIKDIHTRFQNFFFNVLLFRRDIWPAYSPICLLLSEFWAGIATALPMEAILPSVWVSKGLKLNIAESASNRFG